MRREALEAFAAGKKGPKRMLVLFGYAGWAPGQLEAELARGDWWVAPAEADLIFAPDPARSWLEALKRLRIAL